MTYSARLSRRALLAALAGALVAGVSRSARADAPALTPKSRIVRETRDARGTTLVLELENAPFPAAGSWHRDPTVIAYVPSHYRPSREGEVSVVVHFHGHNSTAERAMLAHQLREQLYDSKQNALLLVPELAVMAPDSACGKLETPGAFAKMLEDALATLAGRAALPEDPKVGRVCVSAHSGGYHAAAAALKHGGLRVHETWLFDALYGDVDTFREWVVAGSGGKPMRARHKLVSYFTAGTTEANTRKLFSDLERSGVAVAREEVEGTLSREELTHAEAVSIRTSLSHGAVTTDLNGLRDCLYASALRRKLRTSWFDTKEGARPLERRR